MSLPWHLTVEIAAPDDPISGAVRVEGERDRPFSGWMELFSEMDAALSALWTPSAAGIPSRKEST